MARNILRTTVAKIGFGAVYCAWLEGPYAKSKVFLQKWRSIGDALRAEKAAQNLGRLLITMTLFYLNNLTFF